MTDILIWTGAILFILGGLGMLIAAFRTHILWGLALLLLPPLAIIFYIVMHWDDAKGAFKLQMAGLVLLVGLFLAQEKGFNLDQVQQLLPGFSADSSRTPAPPAASGQSFRCDGRVHCSQMTSCAEATFFLNNCPGTKMDGDGNGIPCERQWCR